MQYQRYNHPSEYTANQDEPSGSITVNVPIPGKDFYVPDPSQVISPVLSPSSSKSKGLIIGLSVGGGMLLIIIILVIIYSRRHKQESYIM